MVYRRALVDQLAGSQGFPIVCLCAPAGYGKTTVLAQWAAADARPFVWLSAQDSHNDPAVLRHDLGEAIASLRRCSSGPARTTAPSTAPGHPAGIPEAILSAPTVPFVLVLDDAHLVSDSRARRLVEDLMVWMPSGSQLVMASRGVAPLSLSRLRADHRVLEITAPEMAFDADEALAALAATGWSGTSPTATQSLVEVCEGWPAVLYLSGLAVRATVDRFHPTRAGRERMVTDYLQAEVLSGIDDATMRFLTHTSILAELSGPLCDAVCDGTGSGSVLRDMRGGAVPIMALDTQDQHYRYHPVLRQALQSELERRESGMVAELHDRASRWFAGHGDIDAAIRHATLAGDVSRVGDLVWAHLHRALAEAGSDRVRGWLAGLTDEQIGQSPELVLASAWLSLVIGDLESMAGWHALARASEGNAPLEDDGSERTGTDRRGSERRGALKLLAAWRGTGGMADVMQLCTDAFDALPPDSTWRPAAGALSGIALALSGRPGQAQARLRYSEELASGLRDHGARVDCLVALGALAFDRGLWRESEDLVSRAHAVMTAHHLQDRPSAAYAVSMVALVQARRGEAQEASDWLDRARRLTAAMAGLAPWIEIQARVVQANTSLLLGDAAAARRLTCQARQLVDDRKLAPLLSAGLEQAEQTLAQLPADSTYGFTPFTVAELRILRLLPTHLSFPEMGAMLFVSRHTVKTQALSTYRKLGAASRHEAVERACALGYLPPTSVPARIA